MPLPALGYYEKDPQYLGVPFFSMDHVEGLVPPDNIPYTMEGWVIEASPEQQEQMWWSGIDALAAVHKTDWRRSTSTGSPCLAGVSRVSTSRCRITATTSTGRRRGSAVPVVESTWQWLVDHQPDEQAAVVLSWGDSRIGNIIWDDFRAAAVLDWEMASLGQPEMDLGWFLYFDRQFTEPLGVPRPAASPRTRRPSTATRSRWAGRCEDLFFYEIFSGFRFAVVMLRLSDLLLETKILPAEADMRSNNIATQLLATMLDLEPPS